MTDGRIQHRCEGDEVETALCSQQLKNFKGEDADAAAAEQTEHLPILLLRECSLAQTEHISRTLTREALFAVRWFEP